MRSSLGPTFGASVLRMAVIDRYRQIGHDGIVLERGPPVVLLRPHSERSSLRQVIICGPAATLPVVARGCRIARLPFDYSTSGDIARAAVCADLAGIVDLVPVQLKGGVLPGIEIYLYSNCSSCRNASALLDELGVAARRRDIFKDRMSGAEIAALFARTNLDPKTVLSTRSRPYGELKLAGKELSNPQIIELMSQHPALIRRPITVRDREAVIGFNRSAITALVSKKSPEERNYRGT
jgi:regulatory protein spx